MAIDQEQTLRLLARTPRAQLRGARAADIFAPETDTPGTRSKSFCGLRLPDVDNRDAVLAAAQRLRVSLEDISIVSGGAARRTPARRETRTAPAAALGDRTNARAADTNHDAGYRTGPPRDGVTP